jgi:tetratricopeptide (TPR) repeat protein
MPLVQSRRRRGFALSKPKRQSDPPSKELASQDSTGRNLLARVAGAFVKLRAWASEHWLRSVLVAGTILMLIATTMATWAYLGSVALQSGQPSLEAALRALDERRFEEARSTVNRMLKSSRLPRSHYGGPLYVLGAIKSYDAENHSAPDKRRTEYLVASRYLQEANAYGFPADRELHGLYLLGRSLVESSQFEEGIRVLDELSSNHRSSNDAIVLEAHRLLSNTCLLMPYPLPEKALQHTDALLQDTRLTDAQRTDTLLHRAACLSRLARFDEARQAVAAIAGSTSRQADAALALGKIELDEINLMLERVAVQERKTLLDASATRVAAAIGHLQRAASLDASNGQIARQSSYHLGRGFALEGQAAAAIKQFAQTRQQYGDSFEGLAATLAEADLLRKERNFEDAVSGYGRVLESFTSAADYRSVVMSLPELRKRFMAALKGLVEQQRFADALALLEQFPPLFSRPEQLELRGDTYERWGNVRLAEQHLEDHEKAAAARTDGLRHLRAAGLAFEQLALLRYGTRFYTLDLWHSANDYFRGHSFSRAAPLLRKYLDNEAELRNAEALLRLGQVYLALGRLPESIAAFEECIEFHPIDSFSYQARIDCAKAHWKNGDMDQAEQLLRDNISGSLLTPESKEWKDSYFQLGILLHEVGRHEEAIDVLEQAMQRYPQDPQRLLAQFIVGESYRNWAQQFSEQARDARTASDRDKSRSAVTERLNIALGHFEEVQRAITLKTHDIHGEPLLGAMLRNCYMLEGTILFDLGTYDPNKYKEAIEAYSNVASLYPDEPFVLETFVQIANCWRRLNQNDKARGSIRQAQIALDRLPPEANFASATALNREEWRMMLADMSTW